MTLSTIPRWFTPLRTILLGLLVIALLVVLAVALPKGEPMTRQDWMLKTARQMQQQHPTAADIAKAPLMMLIVDDGSTQGFFTASLPPTEVPSPMAVPAKPVTTDVSIMGAGCSSYRAESGSGLIGIVNMSVR